MTDRRTRRREPTGEMPSIAEEVKPPAPIAAPPSLDTLEEENRELRRVFDQRKEEADKKARAAKLARDNALLKAQLAATAEFPDGTEIEPGQSLIYPDRTALPERWKDPNREYYWGLPEQEGYLTQIGYVKEAAPMVKQPDGTLARHHQVITGHQLWSTPRELYLQRHQQMAMIAGQQVKDAEDMAGHEGLRGAQTVEKDDLPDRR